MNNYCRNCGNKLEFNSKICSNCSADVLEKRVDPQLKKVELENYKKKENKYIKSIIIYFIITFLLPLTSSVVFDSLLNSKTNPNVYSMVGTIISIGSSLLILSFIIFFIYVRVIMSGSKIIRIMFNVFVILLMFTLISILFLSITCGGLIGHYHGKW